MTFNFAEIRDHFQNDHVQISEKVVKSAQYLLRTSIERAAASRPTSIEISKNFNRRSIFVRVPYGVLPMILQDGRFKSQFESGTSRGSLNPAARRTFEERFFGKTHAIYGFLGMKAFESYYSGYGEISIKIKNRTKKRTTWTNGDSLGLGSSNNPAFVPSLVSNPHHLSLSPYTSSFNLNSLYVECQIHGGLYISDIEEITFSKVPTLELLQVIKDIPIRILG